MRQIVEVRLCFQTRSSDIYVVALKLMHTNSGFGDSNSDMTCAIVKHRQVDVQAKACTQNEYQKRNVFPLQPLKTKEYNKLTFGISYNNILPMPKDRSGNIQVPLRSLLTAKCNIFQISSKRIHLLLPRTQDQPKSSHVEIVNSHNSFTPATQ